MLGSLKGHLEVVRALLAAKAEVNTKAGSGAMPLVLSSETCHREVVRAMLKAGADGNAASGEGPTALMLAAQEGHLEVVHALIGARADVQEQRPVLADDIDQVVQHVRRALVLALVLPELVERERHDDVRQPADRLLLPARRGDDLGADLLPGAEAADEMALDGRDVQAGGFGGGGAHGS